MDLGISARRALVMGASRGLGRAIAEALLAEGVTVAICARNRERLEATAHKIGAVAIPADLSVPGASTTVVRDATARLGGLDILVVNTGGPSPHRFDDIDDEEWRRGFEALWMSSVGAIRACLAGMRVRRWGRVLVVTSIAAREPIDKLMLSNSLRAGLHGLVNSLTREVASDGITVNALMPGYTRTERLVEIGINEAAVCELIPAKRLGYAHEFAALAAFLASEKAAYITGQAIACDGGLLQSI